MASLAGLPIAITGASSGIGRATALACARAGMPVAAGARREDRLASLVDEIRGSGGRAIAVPGDVVRPEDCAALVERALSEFGSIYAVFANAGYGIDRPVHETTADEMREIFETNVFGTAHLVRAAVPHMLRAGRGHVLICSSCLSKLAVPFHGAYSATKAAQEHLGRALRAELAGTGVQVSTVHPVGTETEFSEISRRHARPGGPTPPRTPRAFMQPAEKVADAVVRCLRRPRAEVWTSWPARATFALAGALPWMADLVLARMASRTRDARAG